MRLRIPWGTWHMSDGSWQPHLGLRMPIEIQHAINVENGYSCEHRYLPERCPICGDPSAHVGMLVQEDDLVGVGRLTALFLFVLALMAIAFEVFVCWWVS